MRRFVGRRNGFRDNAKKHRHNEFSGEMKESFIALNVCAYEVSCRAGTIKCSRERQKRRALAPIRHAGKSVPPLIPPKRNHSADKNCKATLGDTFAKIK